MFTPQELERMPIELEKLFSQLEMDIMMDIIRRMKLNNNEITRSADWQIYRLNRLGQSKRSIKKYLEKTLGLSRKEINRIYKDAIKSGYAEDEKLYRWLGKKQIKFEDNKELQQLISAIKEQTNNEMFNITQSTGFIKNVNGQNVFTPLTQYYEETLDNAVNGVLNGAFDYNTVLKKTVQEMTKSGLRSIDYASGRSYRIDTATRMAVMTGVNQVASKISDNNAKELNTEYFEVSAHGTARPSHQVWQGKVYTKKQLEEICGLGTAGGLCGVNCRHSYYPFIPGISERSYTDEELKQWAKEENTPKKYGDKEYTAYEASQEQRKLERLMRKQRQDIKLLKEGGAKEEDIITAQAKYRITSDEYAKFSKTMDLPQQRARVYQDELTGNFGGGKGTIRKIKEIKAQKYKSENQNYFIDEAGNKYEVDGKNVVLKASKKEIEIADIIGAEYETKVKLVPVVLNPQGIKTPDYLINNEKYDLKQIFGNGKNTIDTAIKNKKTQANNFIFDISDSKLLESEAMAQIEKIYNAKNRNWIDKIILIKENKIIKKYSRK